MILVRTICVILLGSAIQVASPAVLADTAASITLGAMIDGQSGSSFDLDGWWAPNDTISFGAGVGRSKSTLTETEFSGTSVRASSDLLLGGFNLGLSISQWKDPQQFDSTNKQLLLGWTSEQGVGLSGLLVDRKLQVHYLARVANQSRPATVNFDATGRGAELSYFGAQWFPQVQTLVDTIITRAAGASKRELSLSLGRQQRRGSLHGTLQMQRDALTMTDVSSLSLRHSRRFSKHWEFGTTLGASFAKSLDTIGFGGLELTLRR
jgi:hypothetical protein